MSLSLSHSPCIQIQFSAVCEEKLTGEIGWGLVVLTGGGASIKTVINKM